MNLSEADSHLPSPEKVNIITHVRALYDFIPTSSEDLEFEETDVIEVHELTYKEWASGTVQGRTGIFPINYVVPLSQVRALAPFAPGVGELGFEAGDIITVIEPEIFADWSTGTLRGKSGNYPRSYAEPTHIPLLVWGDGRLCNWPQSNQSNYDGTVGGVGSAGFAGRANFRSTSISNPTFKSAAGRPEPTTRPVYESWQARAMSTTKPVYNTGNFRIESTTQPVHGREDPRVQSTGPPVHESTSWRAQSTTKPRFKLDLSGLSFLRAPSWPLDNVDAEVEPVTRILDLDYAQLFLEPLNSLETIDTTAHESALAATTNQVQAALDVEVEKSLLEPAKPSISVCLQMETELMTECNDRIQELRLEHGMYRQGDLFQTQEQHEAFMGASFKTSEVLVVLVAETWKRAQQLEYAQATPAQLMGFDLESADSSKPHCNG